MQACYPSGFIAPYRDPESGIELSNSWIQINMILYAPSNYALIVFDVYGSQEAYTQGLRPIFPNNRLQTVNGASDGYWRTYFDPRIMDMPHRDIQAQAIALLRSISNKHKELYESNRIIRRRTHGTPGQKKSGSSVQKKRKSN